MANERLVALLAAQQAGRIGQGINLRKLSAGQRQGLLDRHNIPLTRQGSQPVGQTSILMPDKPGGQLAPAGAAAGTPAPPPPGPSGRYGVPVAYMQPGQRIAATRERLAGKGMGEEDIESTLRQRAEAYARQRLGQFNQVASLLPKPYWEQFNALHGVSVPGMGDRETANYAPLQDYRAASALFAQIAREQAEQLGNSAFTDPRTYLAYLLAQRG